MVTALHRPLFQTLIKFSFVALSNDCLFWMFLQQGTISSWGLDVALLSEAHGLVTDLLLESATMPPQLASGLKALANLLSPPVASVLASGSGGMAGRYYRLALPPHAALSDVHYASSDTEEAIPYTGETLQVHLSKVKSTNQLFGGFPPTHPIVRYYYARRLRPRGQQRKKEEKWSKRAKRVSFFSWRNKMLSAAFLLLLLLPSSSLVFFLSLTVNLNDGQRRRPWRGIDFPRLLRSFFTFEYFGSGGKWRKWRIMGRFSSAGRLFTNGNWSTTITKDSDSSIV